MTTMFRERERIMIMMAIINRTRRKEMGRRRRTMMPMSILMSLVGIEWPFLLVHFYVAPSGGSSADIAEQQHGPYLRREACQHGHLGDAVVCRRVSRERLPRCMHGA